MVVMRYPTADYLDACLLKKCRISYISSMVEQGKKLGIWGILGYFRACISAKVKVLSDLCPKIEVIVLEEKVKIWILKKGQISYISSMVEQGKKSDFGHNSGVLLLKSDGFEQKRPDN